MTPARVWILSVLATLSVAVSSAGCGAAPVRPDAELMAGWVTTELDLGEASVQLDHPPGWPTKAGRKAVAFPAGDMRILTASPGGPRIHVSTFAAPKGFPTTAPDVDRKLEEMIMTTATSLAETEAGLRKPRSRDEIMRVNTVHGGSYKVVRLDDESVPADSTDPEKFKYMTIGVLARDGWLVNFTIFHHEAAPPQGEEVLGVLRTVRVVAKAASPSASAH